MAEIRMRLLGVPEIYVDERPVRLRRRSAVALLAYLVVTDRPQSRDVLAATLAGDTDEVQAQKFLCNALVDLRTALGEFVVTDRHTVAINRQLAAAVDVQALEVALAAAKTGDDLDAMGEAIAMYRGEFLAGLVLRDAPVFDEWLLLQREYFRSTLVQALQATLDRQAPYGTAGAGLELARRLLAIEPWREEAHRALMVLLARSGQRSAALAQFAACRRLLAQELGVEPSQPTLELFQRLKAGPAPIPHNLPAPVEPLVGRETELRHLAGWLADPNCRLITLTGLSGSGKTRLALEAAHRLATADAALVDPPFPDGIFVASLDDQAAVTPTRGANIADDADGAGERIIAAIASAAGVTVPAGSLGGGVSALGERLRQQRMLLLLDGVDEPAGAARLLPSLLSRAPGLKVIVTGRARLHLQCEVVWHLNGLAVPTGGDDLEVAPAGALFLQEARRVRPDLVLDHAARAAAAQVCRLVDGHPLGLLLAARCVPAMAVTELAADLERSLDPLVARDGDLPARQQSLHTIIEAARQRLDEPTRAGLRRLVVFAGGFTRAAARDVAGLRTPHLLALVEVGLARCGEDGRYTIGELVRRYVETELAPPLEDAVQTATRHAQYFATFLAERSPALVSDRPRLNEVTVELPNLYAAWRWATTQHRSALQEQLECGLAAYYDLRPDLHPGSTSPFPATTLGVPDGPIAIARKCPWRAASWTNYSCMRRTRTQWRADVESPAAVSEVDPNGTWAA
jgi:DNA-binding SARP family transcriptional activator